MINDKYTFVEISFCISGLEKRIFFCYIISQREALDCLKLKYAKWSVRNFFCMPLHNYLTNSYIIKCKDSLRLLVAIPLVFDM